MDVTMRERTVAPAPPAARFRLRWSPAWAVEPATEPTTLVLSAGADRRVAIDGVAAADRAAVEAWQVSGVVPSPIGHGDLSHAHLVDRLAEIGAAEPVVPAGSPTVVAGDPQVAAELSTLLTAGRSRDLAVAVRTGSAWPAVPARQLLLGVDLTLHHTVVLGPLAVPGVTACLDCLAARSARRWDVPTVPERPAVQRRLPVVAALLDVQLGLVAQGTSPLLNATMAWNLETGDTDRQALYKLAGCPTCAAAGGASGTGHGRVALPWVDGR
jgi:hypothetical protein